MFTKILNKIKQYNTIIIHRHNKPDGDAIGSQIGLKEAILATFPNKEVLLVGDESERFLFLGKMDDVSDEKYKGALAIILDTGAEYMISDARYKLASYVIKIDHHIPQGEYGDLAYVDNTSESCAGVVTDLIINKKMKLTKLAATALYVGMVTDSGRFRFSSTSSDTFKRASFLLKENIDLDYIYAKLYNEELSNVMLRAEMTLRFIILDCGVAYLKNTYQDVLDMDTTVNNISRGMVNIMSGVNGIDIWANFTENEDGKIYVELRSSKYNINKIAVKYGGGGHTLASGATVDNWRMCESVIDDLIKLAEEGEKDV